MNPLRWRKMSWAIVLFTGLMATWIVAGVAGNADNCLDRPAGSSARAACEAGTDVGTGIAVAGLLGVWFMGFVVLSLVWFMTRPRERF